MRNCCFTTWHRTCHPGGLVCSKNMESFPVLHQGRSRKLIDSSIFGRTFESIVNDLYSIYGHFSIWKIEIFFKSSKFSYNFNKIKLFTDFCSLRCIPGCPLDGTEFNSLTTRSLICVPSRLTTFQ